jgi:hypothetical protein
MSLLVEIATRADVPLEAVVRVLTREPVNADHKGRVLAVLDHLDAEETRVLQRFALAAVHDALPPGGLRADHEDVVAELVDDPLELPEAVRLELGPGPGPEPDPEPGREVEEAVAAAAPAPQAVDPAPLVQLGSVLGELTEAVRELRHETDAERRERVDDLAVLIDLITKGWQGVDRRLGRVERQLGRLEAPPQPREPAARIEPPPVPGPPEPPGPPPDGDDDDDAAAGRRSALRQRLPLLAAVVFGIGVGAAAALDLQERIHASSAVVADRGAAESTQPAPLPGTEAEPLPRAPTTTATSTEPAKQPSPPPARPATTAPAPTTAERTTSAAPPATTAPRPTMSATTSPAPATTRPPTTTAAPAPPPQSSFTPSRNWAWPPTPDADYYLVEFFRGGRQLYRTRTSEARLTLPASVRFTPGVYRWRVRPGTGAPADNRLGDPIVDSEFILKG